MTGSEEDCINDGGERVTYKVMSNKKAILGVWDDLKRATGL